MPDLRKAPNTNDHSAYLATVKAESWSYPAKGNLQTVKQFLWDLEGCGDLEKVKQGDKMLRDRGMLRIPEDSTPKGGKWERIMAHYVMKVLHSIKGEIIDATHPHFGWKANIGLHDIVSQGSMNHIEKSGQIMIGGKSIQGRVDYGYCPLCPYASQIHRTLNNHVWLHFRVSMACRMVDCWYVSHNAEDMWKHAAGHGLATAEPIAQRNKKK